MVGSRTAFAPGSAPLLPGLPRPVRLCHPILMKTAINPSGTRIFRSLPLPCTALPPSCTVFLFAQLNLFKSSHLARNPSKRSGSQIAPINNVSFS